MKRLLYLVAVLGIAYFGLTQKDRNVSTPATTSTLTSSGDEVFAKAFENHQRNVEVHGTGVVTKLLPDDNEGLRHQRFIVRIGSGQTVLIAHNIDQANRINSLKTGDKIEFMGEYIWNPQGGVVHWTHHDSSGRHPPGWIKLNGRTYQ